MCHVRCICCGMFVDKKRAECGSPEASCVVYVTAGLSTSSWQRLTERKSDRTQIAETVAISFAVSNSLALRVCLPSVETILIDGSPAEGPRVSMQHPASVVLWRFRSALIWRNCGPISASGFYSKGHTGICAHITARQVGECCTISSPANSAALRPFHDVET